MILKPETLCHPNIPKPLHGISPRTINGQFWWDKVRQSVYKKYDYHCIACGVSKQDAKKHKWLEAHEFWKISYSTGRCEITSIEPLCHYCHNFIHSGRLAKIVYNEKSENIRYKNSISLVDIFSRGVCEITRYSLFLFGRNDLNVFRGMEIGEKITIQNNKNIDLNTPDWREAIDWFNNKYGG